MLPGGGFGVGQGGEGLRVGGLGYAALAEDCGDVAGGSYVEGGVGGGDVGGDSNALDVGDFGGAALLDRDLVAAGDGQIESGDRRGDVEGNVVFFGQDGDLVGADFVGGVAVGGDAVGSGDDGADVSGFEEVVGRDDYALRPILTGSMPLMPARCR